MDIFIKTNLNHPLACSDCNRLLNFSSYVEGEDKQIYCKGCYSVKFGAMSRGEAKADTSLTFFEAAEGDVKCTGCAGKGKIS